MKRKFFSDLEIKASITDRIGIYIIYYDVTVFMVEKRRSDLLKSWMR